MIALFRAHANSWAEDNTMFTGCGAVSPEWKAAVRRGSPTYSHSMVAGGFDEMS